MRRTVRAPSHLFGTDEFVTGSDLDDSLGHASSDEDHLMQLSVASDREYNDSRCEEDEEAYSQVSGEEPALKRNKTKKSRRRVKKRVYKSNGRSNLPPWEGKPIPDRSGFVKAKSGPSKRAKKLGKSSQWNIASSWCSLFLPPSFWFTFTRETNTYRSQNGWNDSIAESMFDPL